MRTLGLELSDAGLMAAVGQPGQPAVVAVTDGTGATAWPGFAASDGRTLTFGRAAEEEWFVHPRRVNHAFWSRLAHEPSPLTTAGRPAAFSELAFHFLREFVQRAEAAHGRADQVVLAVPGAYLKDAATEEEKIGLLLGIAGELRLPLAGLVDPACAALCDPRGPGFNPSLPVVVVDLCLEAADLTLVTTEGRLQRSDYLQLPQLGLAPLLKHLTGTMGNRFLQQTAFDILADGRLEQGFFRQTRDFLLGGAAEHRFQLNTAHRTYEMLAKREQLAADAQGFTQALVQGLQAFVHASAQAAEPCTVALTDRAAALPGLEARLRALGFGRIIRLPAGAAAAGAVHLAAGRLAAARDLAEVPVETALPLELARRAAPAPWEVVVGKQRASGDRPAPTHLVIEGIAHPLGAAARLTLGAPGSRADVLLPEALAGVDHCLVPLVREQGRLWLVDAAATRDTGSPGPGSRLPLEAGDRLTFRAKGATAEVLLVHVPPAGERALR